MDSSREVRGVRLPPETTNGLLSTAKNSAQSSANGASIVALSTFIHATRDSGYKATSHAVAELVDNAIQADANNIAITVTQAQSADSHSIELRVRDDGTGMNRSTLRQALRFGGSTRFNARTGLGRFGMGLPNSSLSQARRVTVYSWQASREVFMTYLDVDEIASGSMTNVPPPRRVDLPPDCSGRSGTIVAWSRCDRLDHRRVSTIVRRLVADLGRQFRHLLTGGLAISVNGSDVPPVDPLFLNEKAQLSGAMIFGHKLEYEVLSNPDDADSPVGRVCVTFSELPVHDWYTLSNDQKRELGISKGAGVSIVRAGREVDYGWYFLGSKSRENYDDWWRCEIQFDPILDDAFGLTHTKQQIRPKSYLLESLSPDVEATARALNARVRKAHIAAKNGDRFTESVSLAENREPLLAPLLSGPRARDVEILSNLHVRRAIATHMNGHAVGADSRMAYQIVETDLRETSFFNYARGGDRLVLVINPNHPFYKLFYGQLLDQDDAHARQIRTQFELVLLAAARAEAAEHDSLASAHIEQYRQVWSDTLATFLNP
ncbi:MAG: ATP-binding protein [Dehalococcoidia bacterium]|nr:ATP-binding protein [Dehalococcoidia bacterium]